MENSMFGPELNTGCFVSQLAGDPDLRELIERFVHELPQRLAKLRLAACADNLPEVGRLAHQLKGAGGSYGFPALTEAAHELERAARVVQSSSDVCRALEWLNAVCDRTRVAFT
jgi:HPt (histidine-containing phosphotransfer) domain-containing protein